MKWRRRWWVWYLALSLVAWLGLAAGPVAAAGRSDTLRLVQVRARQESSNGGGAPVQFEVTVNYTLASAPRAFLLLFIFEDSSDTATTQARNAVWVPAGSGSTPLAVSYRPPSGLHTIMLVAGLFQDSDTLLAWSATPVFSLSRWPGREWFDRALKEHQAGDYAGAVADLTRAIALAPRTAAYYCWRADSQMHQGAYAAAVVDYTHALALEPENRSCRLGRGIAYLWQRDWTQAVADLSQVIESGSSPDRWTAAALRARGIADVGLGRFAAAIADYRGYLSLISGAPDRLIIQGWISDLEAAGG